jgi:hypothetical protein
VTVTTLQAASASAITNTTVPSDGATARVQAEVLLRERGAASGEGLSASYPLTLTARGGRWEVTRIDTALQRATDALPDAQPGAPSPTVKE